jgi:hypothetical protein
MHPSSLFVLTKDTGSISDYEAFRELCSPRLAVHSFSTVFVALTSYRTLCCAYADLEPKAYAKWNQLFEQANSAIKDRKQKVIIVITVAHRVG